MHGAQLPLPLLLFGGLLRTWLEVSPYAIAIALTAFFIMQVNLHRQAVRKPEYDADGTGFRA